MQTLIDYDELPDAVRSFVRYKLTVQGRSQKTMDEYALDLRTFFRFLIIKRTGTDPLKVSDEDFAAVNITDVDMPLIESVTSEEIYDFLHYTLESRGNKWSARSRKLSALRSFYKYLTVNKRVIENDPMKNINRLVGFA